MSEEQPELEDQLVEAENKYLRALAEAENMKKRLHKERQEMVKWAETHALLSIVPILDQFDKALQFASASSPEVQAWAQGFLLFSNQFQEALGSFGLQSYSSVGALFDPELHEAIEVEENDSLPDGTIIEEFAKGYKAEGRVVRPSKVKVTKKTLNEESV